MHVRVFLFSPVNTRPKYYINRAFILRSGCGMSVCPLENYLQPPEGSLLGKQTLTITVTIEKIKDYSRQQVTAYKNSIYARSFLFRFTNKSSSRHVMFSYPCIILVQLILKLVLQKRLSVPVGTISLLTTMQKGQPIIPPMDWYVRSPVSYFCFEIITKFHF